MGAFTGVAATAAALLLTSIQVRDAVLPADLIASAGPISIVPDKPKPGNTGGAVLYVPLLVHNTGGSPGVLSDLVIVARSGEIRSDCIPIYTFDLAKWLEARVEDKPSYIAMPAPFVPPVLGPGEQQQLQLAFTCEPFSNLLLALAAGQTTFSVYGALDNSTEYSLLLRRTEPTQHPSLAGRIERAEAFMMLDPSRLDARKAITDDASSR